MTLCLVTDRRRLAGGDAPLERARRCLVSQIRSAAAAGVELVQIRERDLGARDLASLVRDAAAAVRGSRTKVVVNDRLDVALACGADGVHLRGDSIPVAAARQLAPAGFLIGRSVRTVAEAQAAVNADYLIAGTVFASVSKPALEDPLGLEGLGAIVRATSTPVLAIGGVTRARLADIQAAGAAGAAAIGLFLGAGAFDSLKTAS